MSKNFSIVLATFLLSLNLLAQEPELVADFDAGAEDSFSRFTYAGANIGNDIILPITSATAGIELALISNGELSLLKDIFPGAEDSDPRELTLYKGEIYFSVKESENNIALWKTDGTTTGTQMVLGLGESNLARPRTFVIAENGWMYFGSDGKIFRTDGANHEEVYDGISLHPNNFCRYENGVAFLLKNDDDSFSLFAINDDQAIELATTASTDFFADGIGLATVTDGLMFSIYESNEVDGIYVYDKNDQSLNVLSIDNEQVPARRTFDFTDDINICWIGGKGYYAVNGKQNETELLFASTNESATIGEDIVYAKHNDKAVFVADEGFFGEKFLMFTDGTTAGTESLMELMPFESEFIRFNQYAYFATGTSNGYDPILHQVDLVSGELKLLYAYDESSLEIESVLPIGVQNNKLYFLSNIDADVGRELYSLDLDIASGINEQNFGLDFAIAQEGSTIEIKMGLTEDLLVSIYNTSGALLSNRSIQSNQAFKTDLPTGMYFMQIIQNGKQASFPIHLIRE